jgi:hypothetical protein
MTVAISPHPWTRNQFLTELRKAKWRRLGAAASTYISPDDPTLYFYLDNWRYDTGIQWEHYAIRRELPATTRPAMKTND